MKKFAFVFSGQGSQYPAMGSELYQNYACVRQVYEAGSDILGLDLYKATMESDEQQLAKTGLAQPLIFTLSVAAAALLREKGITPAGVAGFSLGECSAVTVAGGVSLEDGFRLIRSRAQFMEEAANQGSGAMSAIIGLDDQTISRMCDEVSGYVVPVNFNCDGQTVIAGETAAIEQAEQAMLEAGAAKAVRLAVSGAFHSRMMESASQKLHDALAGMPSLEMQAPLFSNLTGGKINRIENIPEYFQKQMVSPVQWKQCVGAMMADGMEAYVELGPKKTLCSFIRKIDRSNKVFNVEDEKSLSKLLTAAEE
ncbi:MAG: ACP S-malonyltransferase [Eubacteriales bacterium]|jgi:[acyl-carrier-protein] S-malonyltransferase